MKRDEAIALAKRYVEVPHTWCLSHEDAPLLARALLEEVKCTEIGDKIIADRNRVLDALPCPIHGQCVPHALEEIARLKQRG